MICSSDYQQNWEKSSQAETTKDYQHCHSNTRRITQGLENTCMSSPLIACMWWCFRGRTLLNHLQRAQGKWGSVKSVWESMSKMPVLCYPGEELQTIPVHLEQLSGTVPLLDSGVFLQEEQGTWLLQIPTAMMLVVFLLYPTIFILSA